MSGFKFNPSQPGLRKTLREYEELDNCSCPTGLYLGLKVKSARSIFSVCVGFI